MNLKFVNLRGIFSSEEGGQVRLGLGRQRRGGGGRHSADVRLCFLKPLLDEAHAGEIVALSEGAAERSTAADVPGSLVEPKLFHVGP